MADKTALSAPRMAGTLRVTPINSLFPSCGNPSGLRTTPIKAASELRQPYGPVEP